MQLRHNLFHFERSYAEREIFSNRENVPRKRNTKLRSDLIEDISYRRYEKNIPDNSSTTL